MLKKTVSGIMLVLLLIGIMAFNVQPVKSDYTWTETIYIRADGSIYPSDAPIITFDNVTYTLTSNINGSIIVQRDNIVVNGNYYSIQGSGVGASESMGIELSASNVTVKNTQIKGFWDGIYLLYSSHNNIIGNTMIGNEHGVSILHSSNNSIVGNNVMDDANGISLWDSSNSSIIGNNITNNGIGIQLWSSSNYNDVIGNTITLNGIGISLELSLNNNILGNKITKENSHGIKLYNSSNNSIVRNSITNSSSYGTYLIGSSNNNITGNNITNNERGIFLSESSNNMVLENNITENKWYNIWLFSSSSNSFFRNNITAGMKYGIHLDYSFNNNISRNNITNNWYAIELWDSCNNNIYENSVTNNGYGLGLYWDSFNNNISGNNITNNLSGIHLYYSSNNSFFGNTLVNNTYGLELLNSLNNLLYHNNFICNTKQVNAYNSTNILDDGYPSGGNYWSDYNGTDLFSGSYQNQTGSDGIGDTPYGIDANNIDHYPLMGMFYSFNVSWVDSGYIVNLISNSTISGFNVGVWIEHPENPNTRIIMFNVNGENDTIGFCRVCIPTALLNRTYTVFVNGTEVPSNLLPCSNSTYSYLYFSYTHSTQVVTIIPEFPSAIILPIIMAFSTIAITFTKRRKPKSKH